MSHPQIKVRTWQQHHMRCPYCKVGHGILRVSAMSGDIQGSLQDPILCRNPHCGKDFMVKAQVQFWAVTMEDAAQPLPRRKGYVG